MSDPKKSEGARLERRAFRDYIRRRLKKSNAVADGGVSSARELSAALEFVLERQDRYDPKPGGLGRK